MTPTHAAHLLILAAREAGTLRAAAFNPDQERDDHGRWTDGDFPSETKISDARTKSEATLVKQVTVVVRREAKTHNQRLLKAERVTPEQLEKAVAATTQLLLEDENQTIGQALGVRDSHVADAVADALSNFRGASARAETPLHATADRHVPVLSVALRYAFAVARKALKANPRDADKAIAALEKALESVLPATLLKVYDAGGVTGAGMLQQQLRGAEDFRTAKKKKKRAGVGFEFNHVAQHAVAWAAKHAAELITGILETTRERINAATVDVLEAGDWDAHLDEILAAVGDEDRADLIARNETMVAVHEGQREAWGQAVEAGLLTGDEEREWIVVGDEKVCPICEGLEGKHAKLGQAYVSDEGESYDGPPAHVSCRCSEGIV